ncbi:MAG: hypothetical protein JSR87_03825 [Proteobacteria bacterium]|nr:hypothetical protein [Pseudomonadota bacterium]MBS0572009.1 hypothetical protein [Pseudomonadota bacterium]
MKQLRRLGLLAPAFALLPVAAEAHNFAKGTIFPQIIEGIGASLNSPSGLLTLIPLGIMASVWQTEGILRLMPPLAAGLVAGIFLALFGSPAYVVPSLSVGIICALLAVIARPWPFAPLAGLAAVAGVLVNMVTLEGHGFGELQFGIYIGIVLGAAAIPLISAAVARGALQKVPAFWMRLAWRIIASWSAAIALMYMTFQLKAIVGG